MRDVRHDLRISTIGIRGSPSAFLLRVKRMGVTAAALAAALLGAATMAGYMAPTLMSPLA